MAPSTLTTAALTAAALLSSFSESAPAGMMSLARRQDPPLPFQFGSEKVRGVNLGGWLVLEPWITPSIFEAQPEDVVDVYSMSAHLGKDGMENVMEGHWSTFITEADFQEIAGNGLNFVRIPVGYWSIAPIEGDPYIQGAFAWLQRALDWAQSAGLRVMIDLHAAPGSQNGFDNSGEEGDVEWSEGNTVQQTFAAIRRLDAEFSRHPAVAAIELLNEPLGSEVDLSDLTQFYQDGWDLMKDSPVAIAFSDAFQGVEAWNDFGTSKDDLILDVHHYEVFDSESLEMTVDEHVGSACGYGDEMEAGVHWTVAGEWTGAMTDCAKWLNGRGYGARYDGTFNKDGEGSYYIGSCEGKSTGTVAGLSKADKSAIAAYINAQIVGYEKAEGWFFWTWKNEAAPEWHMQDLFKAGLIDLNSIDTSICG